MGSARHCTGCHVRYLSQQWARCCAACQTKKKKKNKDRIRVYAFPVNIVSVLSIAVLLPTPSFRVRHTLNKLLSSGVGRRLKIQFRFSSSFIGLIESSGVGVSSEV